MMGTSRTTVRCPRLRADPGTNEKNALTWPRSSGVGANSRYVTLTADSLGGPECRLDVPFFLYIRVMVAYAAAVGHRQPFIPI